jgi:uncharacterized protein (TIGR02145 family)
MKAPFQVISALLIGLLLVSAGCKKDDANNHNNDPKPDTVTDIDGNTYTTIKIGDQLWMAENLNTTTYKNGIAIPLVTDHTVWANLSTPGYCWYENDSSAYGSVYGALYNWYALATGTLCPSGWHVPSDQEWKALEMHLGMTQLQIDETDWRGTDEGGKMKEEGTSHWIAPNLGATNSSGFTALPGGGRGADDGLFAFRGYFGFWWTSSPYGVGKAWYRSLDHNGSYTGRSCVENGYGFSVRCVRD